MISDLTLYRIVYHPIVYSMPANDITGLEEQRAILSGST